MWKRITKCTINEKCSSLFHFLKKNNKKNTNIREEYSSENNKENVDLIIK